jgi:uncharacterized protein YceK
MKILTLVLMMLALSSCGKTWRSKTEPNTKSTPKKAGQLEQWSGRSDYLDTGWQVKSQP